MKDFLKLLLEGDSSDETEELTTDESVDKEIEESCLPTGVLIESTFADINISLNAALETYQMACIVGGVRVVSEGMDQSGATAILTEASDNILTKIKEAIIKAKDWLVSLVKKVIDSAKLIGKDTLTKFKAVEADFDKNFESGKFKYKGYMIDMSIFDELLDNVDDETKKSIDYFRGILTSFANSESDAVSMGESYDKLIADPVGFYIENMAKQFKSVDISDAKSVADITEKIKEASGYGSDGGKEILVTSAEVTKMKDIIALTGKEDCKKERQMAKTVSKMCDDLIKDLKSVESKNKPNVTKWAQASAKMFNFISNLSASVINLKIKTVSAAARSYLGWMKQVATGKGVTEGADYIEEGFDTIYLFEEADLEDMVEEPVEERTMFANLKAMQTWFGDNASQARDFIKEANSAFAKEDYKKAQDYYEKAKKECEAAVKELHDIDQNMWTTVFGVMIWGWYYAIWHIITQLLIAATTPAMKLKWGYTKADLKDKQLECQKNCQSTQKVIGGLLGQIIAFCDLQIDLCKHPNKIATESYNFEGADDAALMMEGIMTLIEGCGGKSEDDDDDGGDEPTTEGSNILDLAMTLLS